jgi:hypothetical protein
MTDLWYTYGAMVADPGLLKAIGDAKPLFPLIGMTVTEQVDGQPNATYTRPAAGFLDALSTTNVRQAIHTYVTKNPRSGAPPISLYTAGKFCQLWNTLPSLTKLITDANGAFTKAGGNAATSSAALLTIIGLCLLDTTFITENVLPPDEVANTAAEFGLDPKGAEWQILQTLVRDPVFGDAHTELFTAGCWKGIQACAEVFVFYGNFIRAVN